MSVKSPQNLRELPLTSQLLPLHQTAMLEITQRSFHLQWCTEAIKYVCSHETKGILEFLLIDRKVFFLHTIDTNKAWKPNRSVPTSGRLAIACVELTRLELFQQKQRVVCTFEAVHCWHEDRPSKTIIVLFNVNIIGRTIVEWITEKENSIPLLEIVQSKLFCRVRPILCGITLRFCTVTFHGMERLANLFGDFGAYAKMSGVDGC